MIRWDRAEVPPTQAAVAMYAVQTRAAVDLLRQAEHRLLVAGRILILAILLPLAVVPIIWWPAHHDLASFAQAGVAGAVIALSWAGSYLSGMRRRIFDIQVRAADAAWEIAMNNKSDHDNEENR